MLEVHVSITAVAVLTIILIISLIGLLFYLYPASNKLTTIPGPNVSDVNDGNLNDIERSGSLHEYLHEIHNEYGAVVAFKYGQPLVVSVADPKHFAPRTQLFDLPDFLFEHWRPLVGDESFLYSTGLDVFKRREHIDFNVKHNSKVSFAKSFRSLTTELTKKWTSLPEGQHIPLSQHMKGLATKAVCQMMFGQYFEDNSRIIKLHSAWDLCWSEVIASSKKEPSKSKSDLEKATEELHSIFEEAIENQWKKSNKPSSTILDGLLKASNGEINEKQLLSDVITLFTIGVQVTWAVLTWSCYFVAVNPDVQEKLRKKLKVPESLDIMPESLCDMKMLKCILKETVRCSEMFSWSGRQQDIDIMVDEHVVSKQTPVIEAISVVMKREDIWAEPCKFDPSRFTDDDDEKQLNTLDFIPFAFGGSRRQPQESLVYLLASVVLATVFRDFEVTIAGSDLNYNESNYDGFVAMPSKEEVWVTLSVNGGSKKVDADFEIVGRQL